MIGGTVCMKKIVLFYVTFLIAIVFLVFPVNAKPIEINSVIGTVRADYYDELFSESSYSYNHELAQLSISMEIASFTKYENETYGITSIEDAEVETKRAENILQAYENIGFKNVKLYNYDKSLNDTSDRVAFSIAVKELKNGESLVAVVIRGGGYGCEWSSNFNVGNGQTGFHQGFLSAMEEVYANLIEYIAGMNNIKIWITGYSRAGAVANLLAGRLVDNSESSLNVCAENIYTYTFATPNGVMEMHNPHDKKYNNIYNIINPADLVPRVAFEGWGFTKYGITREIYFTSTNIFNYPYRYMEVDKFFKELSGMDFDSLLNLSYSSSANDIEQIIVKVLPDLGKIENAQKAVQEVMEFFFTKQLNEDGNWINYRPEDFHALLYKRYGENYILKVDNVNRYFMVPGLASVLEGALQNFNINMDVGTLIFSIFEIHDIETDILYSTLLQLVGTDILKFLFSIPGLTDKTAGLFNKSHIMQVYVSWMSLNEESIFNSRIGITTKEESSDDDQKDLIMEWEDVEWENIDTEEAGTEESPTDNSSVIESKQITLKEVRINTVDKIDSYVIFYNQQGLVERIEESINEEVLFLYSFEYDEQGHIILVSEKNNWNELLYSITWNYDENGNISEIHHAHIGSVLHSYYTYNAEGRVASEIIEQRGQSEEAIYSYSNDEYGNLVQTRNYPRGVEQHIYDNNGRELEFYNSTEHCYFNHDDHHYTIKKDDRSLNNDIEYSISLYDITGTTEIISIPIGNSDQFLIDADGYIVGTKGGKVNVIYQETITFHKQVMTEEQVVNKLKEATSDNILSMFCDDFDADGSKEMFAVIGEESNNSVWFSNGENAINLGTERGFVYIGSEKVCKLNDGKKLFIVESGAGGSGTASNCWYVKSGNAIKVDKAGERLVQLSGNDFAVHPSAFDLNTNLFDTSDKAGHTWKRYYIKWVGDRFEEYAGVQISTNTLLDYTGAADIIQMARDEGYSISSVIYRENNIINVNLYIVDGQMCQNQNLTLQIEGDQVIPVKVNDFGDDSILTYSYGGIYMDRGF